MKKIMTILLSVFLFLTLMPNIMAEGAPKDYPADLKVEETENGDIKISTNDLDFLNEVVKQNEPGTGDNYSNRITIKNKLGFAHFANTYPNSDTITVDENDKSITVSAKQIIVTGFSNGYYTIEITTGGTYKEYSGYIELSNLGVDGPIKVVLSQTDSDVIISVEGDYGGRYIDSLYTGGIVDDSTGTSRDGKYINVHYYHDGLEYLGRIENGKYIDANGNETFDEKLRKVDGKLYISKESLRENGFYDGEYFFEFYTEGNVDAFVRTNLDLNKEFIKTNPTKIILESNYKPVYGDSTHDVDESLFKATAIINGKEVLLSNDEFYIYVDDNDDKYPFTEDQEFIEGNEYRLVFDFNYKGHKNDVIILEIEGNSYTAVPSPKGATGMSAGSLYLITSQSKKALIPLTVSKPKQMVNLPTANKGLVYTGEELVGVYENEAYTLTDNKATNAGNYIAKAVLNEGYVWKDGTTETKGIEWSISKATPKYEIPTDLKAAEGDKLSTVKLPSGWTWKDGSKVVSNVGNVAVYTPSDTNNYLTVEEKLNIELTYKVVVDDSSLELNSKVETENNESTSDNTGDAYVNNDGISASIKDIITNEKSNTVIEGKAKDLIDKAVEATKEGKDVKINVVTTLVKKEKDVTGVAKEELKEIETLTKGLTVQSYLDLSMILNVETTIEGNTVGTEEDSLLKELDKPVELVLKLDLPKDFNAKDYKFYVIAVHENADGSLETSKKEAKYNTQDSTISFETDKFSTYAVAYEKVSTEKPSEPSKPSTPSTPTSKPNYIIPNTSTR